MKYRKLGKTGLRVSCVGFGSWQFGGEWGRSFTEAEASSLLSRAQEKGINFIDTAECYGDGLSERLIGQAIRGQREKWIIATKFGHKYHGLFQRTERWSAAEAVQQLEESLVNLGTDYIDLYQSHSAKKPAFDNDELWTALADQVKAGKIRHLGFSISPSDNVDQVDAAARVGAEVIQVVYNRLERTAENRVFPSCVRQGLGVLARVPLASGFLSGRFKPGAEESFSSDEVRGRTYDREQAKKMIAEAARLRESEVPKGVDMATWALAFCLQHPAVTCVIPGMKTPAQVDSNAAASELADATHPQAG